MRYFALNTTNVANTQSLVRDAKNKRKLKKKTELKGLLSNVNCYKTPLESINVFVSTRG